MTFDLHRGIEGGQPLAPGVDLQGADVAGGEQDLALEIGQGDHVGVAEAHHAHAGRYQIEGGRGSQAAGADDQNPGGLEVLLAGPADFAEHEMAGVAFDLVVGKRRRHG